MKKYVIATAVFLMVSLIFTACGSTGASGSDQTGAGKDDQDIFTELKSKAEELGVDTDIVQNQEADQALLEQFTGEMDLSGPGMMRSASAHPWTSAKTKTGVITSIFTGGQVPLKPPYGKSTEPMTHQPVCSPMKTAPFPSIHGIIRTMKAYPVKRLPADR